MKRMIRLLAIAGIIAGAAWLGRARREGDLAHLVTQRFNPLVMRFGLAGGRRSPWAILEHVGRTSGTLYQTPIVMVARPTDDHVYVRLPYGSGVQWVKNVRAAGHCRVQAHETILELDEPAIIPASENPIVPPRLRAGLDRTGRTYLRLHILERIPGTFTHHPAESGPALTVPPIEVLHPDAVPSP
jgi:deazaflavin-dependent oxidoreductase (nitroreductase family)